MSELQREAQRRVEEEERNKQRLVEYRARREAYFNKHELDLTDQQEPYYGERND